MLELNSKTYKTQSKLDLEKLDPFLYLGGITNFHYSFMRSFSGSMSQLLFNGQQVDLSSDARLFKKFNVKYSSTCSNAMCNNRGICIRAQNRVGYKCHCRSTSFGFNCENSREDDDLEEKVNDKNARLNKVTCQERNCKNGGFCSTKGKCACRIKFSGSDCSKG